MVVPKATEKSERKMKMIDRTPPNGGYGWMITFASFLSSVIVDGVCFAFGIFYLEFLVNYEEDRGKTAAIGSVLNGMYMVTAPVSGALVSVYGCRPVAVVGALWASLAFCLSTLCPDINSLILVYGVLAGIGFGLMYLPSMIIVSYYFTSRRALATGIATCGSGIGAFILAPAFQWLISVYGWKGTTLIMAGIVLNGVVLGLLYRPLGEAQGVVAAGKGNMDAKRDRECLTESDSTCKIRNAGSGDHAEDVSDNLIKDTLENSDTNEYTTKHKSNLWETSDESLKQHPTNNQTKSLPAKQLKPSPFCTHMSAVLDSLVKSVDVSLLKIVAFDIYGFSCILCMAGFFVPFTYLPDHCLSLGYTGQQGAFLLSILGIANTFGRVLAGWLSDRPWADCLLINNLSLIVGGVCTVICPFLQNYLLLCLYSVVFGLCLASFVSLRSIILVDLIGLHRLTRSFGIIVLCQGISSFFGSPLAGFLRERTDGYSASFYLAGSVIAAAGLICLPLRRIAALQHTSIQQPSQVLQVT